MPKPRKGETKQEFLNRCIPIVSDEPTTKNHKQAIAICYSYWDRTKTIIEQYIAELENKSKDS